MELQEPELCRASGLYESPRLLYGSSTFSFATHRQDFEPCVASVQDSEHCGAAGFELCETPEL